MKHKGHHRFSGMPGLEGSPEDETLRIQWVPPRGVLTQMLGKFEPGPFLASGQFADLILVGRDGASHAHRLLLGATCPLLRALLESQTEEVEAVATVLLPDFSIRHIRALLELVYGIEEHRTNAVLAADLARSLGCTWLAQFGLADDTPTSGLGAEPPPATPRPGPEKSEKRMASRQKLLEAVRDPQPLQFTQAVLSEADMAQDESHRYFCPVIDCNYTSIEKDFLIYHVNQLHRSVKCQFCGLRMPKLRLPVHVKNVHPQESHLYQEVSFQVQTHEDETGSERTVPKLKIDAEHRLLCPTPGCPFAHLELAVMMKHIEAHVNEVCDQCHRVFTKKAMESHKLKAHRAIEGGEVDCSDCHRTFSDISCLARHRKARHPNTTECVCRWCGKNCIQETSLKIHESSCDKRGIGPCKRPNASISKMQKRKKQKLEEVDLTNIQVQTDFLDSNKCARCSFKSSDPSKLKQHWVSKHEYRSCEHCGNMYSYNYIDQHIAVHHTKQLDFECEYCHKKFWMESYLINHRDEEHIKEYKFKCGACELSFFSQYRLSRHKIREHKNRNFACKYCEKTYLNKESLKKHFQKVHGIPIENVKGSNRESIIPLSSLQAVLHDPDGKKIKALEEKALEEQEQHARQVQASPLTIPDAIHQHLVVQDHQVIQDFPIHAMEAHVQEPGQVQEIQLAHLQPESDPNYVTTTYTITM